MIRSDVNPIDPAQRLRDAPRCTATAKRSGQPCKAPAVRGWSVCRVHGVGGGAPSGPTHPNHRHGLRTKEARLFRRMITVLSYEAGK